MAMILDKFEAELFDRFGWTTEEIKSMKENQIKINEEHKLMTKAEAIERHAETQTNSMLEYWSETKAKSKLFIEGLEALGFIEFKEEEKLSTKITEAGKFGIREETVIKVIDSINIAGYKIVLK